jgi:FkbM family methyltransferase
MSDLGVEMLPTTINGRWELWLPRHRAERPEWATGWEPERLASMADRIGPGDVVLDVGAEEGDFPALWASWGADVVMVEPNPKVWPNIKAIFDTNGLTERVRGWFVGFCGDFERPAGDDQWADCSMYGDGAQWPACASGPVIGDHGFLVLPERPEVPVATVDLLARVYGTPTVITIDVEGAELTVLRGAVGVLSGQLSIRPLSKPTVFVSIHIDLPWIDEKYPGDTGDKVREFMAAYGYTATHLATDHEEHWRFDP